MMFSAISQKSGDMRSLPESCKKEDPNREKFWSAAQDYAFPDPANPVPAGGMDSMALGTPGALKSGKLVSSLFDAKNCKNIKPILTGVPVTFNGEFLYDDAVCAAPGCYYDPSGGGSCKASP